MTTLSVADAREILSALRLGTVPQKGLGAIAVGVEEILSDLDEQLEFVATGRSGFRFVQGAYGSGKSFLCSLARDRALDSNFATSAFAISADAPVGDMAMLYRRVAEGLRTAERRSSCALRDIVERWLSVTFERCAQIEGVSPRSREHLPQITQLVEKQIEAALDDVGGADVGLARALRAYFVGRSSMNPELARDAIQWLRGSKSLPVDARRKLGVKGEVTRDTAFAMLVGLLRLVRLAGYRGTLITMDEAETILRLPLSSQRQAAYETLRLFIDACGENSLPGAFFVVTGTEQFLADRHAGVASYAALAQRIERPVGVDVPDARRSALLVLRGLDTEKLAQVARTVRDLHGMAFNYNARLRLSDELLARLSQQATTAFGEETPRVPRRFLREVIYLCDLCEEHQHYDPASYVLGSAPPANTPPSAISES